MAWERPRTFLLQAGKSGVVVVCLHGCAHAIHAIRLPAKHHARVQKHHQCTAVQVAGCAIVRVYMYMCACTRTHAVGYVCAHMCMRVHVDVCLS